MHKIEFSGKFTARLLRSLEMAGFDVDLSIDLSRNRHFAVSENEGPVSRRISAGEPAVYVFVRQGTCDIRQYQTRCSTWLNRRLADFIRIVEASGGFDDLSAPGVSIVCSNFDSALINLRQPPLAIKNAVDATQVTNTKEFDCLPPQTRAAMGVYWRVSNQRYVRIGAPAHPAPTATGEGFPDRRTIRPISTYLSENLVGPAGLEPATKAL